MADSHDRCLNEGTISEMKANIRAIFQRIDEMRAIYENLAKLTDSVHQLTVNMSVFAEQMKDTKEDMAKIRNDLDYMKNMPVKDYRDTKKSLISAVLGAVVGILVAVITRGAY